MNNQIMSNFEQPNTPLMNEKLPGIDKLPKLDENLVEVKPEQQQQQQQMLPSSAYLPPPPPPHTFNFNPNMMYNQHMSPPLTPAVSPSSVLLDSMQFKRKFSVDIGPFGFGSNIPHPSSVHDQDVYRRSSCSAVSMDSMNQPEPHSATPSPPPPTSSSSVANGYSVAVTAAAAAAAAVRCQSDYTFLNTSMQHHSFGNHPSNNATTTTSTAVTAPSPKHRRGSRAQHSGPNTQHKHACKYPYCSWSFKRYEHLKRHMLVHTGKRPHVCHFPGCGKSFSRSDNFHAHYRTHTKKASLAQNKKSAAKNDQAETSHDTSSSSNTAAAATVAAAAAAVSSSSSSNTNVMTPQHQVFQERTYFKQAPAFHMTFNQDMYNHRYPPEEPYQQHYMRNFQQQNLFSTPNSNDNFQSTMTTPTSSPNGSSSLLNHEQQTHPPFYHHPTTSSPMHSPPSDQRFNYMLNNTNSYGYQDYTEDNDQSIAAAAAVVAAAAASSSPTTATTPKSGRKSSSASSNQQKSHICPITQCHRRFKRLEHLKRHMRIHTLERPFGCSFPNCHKTFSRSDNLSQHMKTHQRVEDRRRKQQQQPVTTTSPPNQHLSSLNYSQPQSQPSNNALMMNMSWHSTGTVGC